VGPTRYISVAAASNFWSLLSSFPSSFHKEIDIQAQKVLEMATVSNFRSVLALNLAGIAERVLPETSTENEEDE